MKWKKKLQQNCLVEQVNGLCSLQTRFWATMITLFIRKPKQITIAIQTLEHADFMNRPAVTIFPMKQQTVQTLVSLGAVWSGSALSAQALLLSYLGNLR